MTCDGRISLEAAEQLVEQAYPELSGWAVLEIAGIVAELPSGRAVLEELLRCARYRHVLDPPAYLLKSARNVAERAIKSHRAAPSCVPSPLACTLRVPG